MSANAAEVGEDAAEPELCEHADPRPATPTPAPTVATALMKPRRPSRPISADVISWKVGSVIVTSRHQQIRRAKLPKPCDADVARRFGLCRPLLPQRTCDLPEAAALRTTRLFARTSLTLSMQADPSAEFAACGGHPLPSLFWEGRSGLVGRVPPPDRAVRLQRLQRLTRGFRQLNDNPQPTRI